MSTSQPPTVPAVKDPARTTRRPASKAKPPRRRRRRRRRWPWILLGCAVVLGSLGGLAAWYAPKLGARLIRKRIIPAMERRFKRKVSVGRIKSSLTRVVLEDVKVRGPLDCPGRALMHAERITMTYAFWPILRGKLQLESVTIDRPRFCLRRLIDGTDNISDVLRELARRKLGNRITLKLSAIRLIHGTLEAYDERHKLAVRAPELKAKLMPGGQSTVTLQRVRAESPRFAPAQAREVTFAFRTKRGRLQGQPQATFSGGRLRLHDRLVLTDMAGTLLPGKGAVRFDIEGGYGDVGETLWRAAGKARIQGLLDPRKAQITLALEASKLSLDKLAPVLPKRLIVQPERASLHAELSLKLAAGRLSFQGETQLSGLNLSDPMLAAQPVTDIGFHATLGGSYDLNTDTLLVEKAQIRRRRLNAELSLKWSRLRQKEPRIWAKLSVPRLPCQDLIDAIPTGLAPELQGLRLTGNFAMALEAEVDFGYLTLSSVHLGGFVDRRRCRVARVPRQLSARRLRGPFTHEVIDGVHRLRFEVGPDNPDFVRIEDVSPHLIKAVLTTEDSRFYYHRGFIPKEFGQALAKNLIKRRFVFGASSITMQMVKNVLLGRRKTLARKLQELVLTWYVERTLSKKRIMEIYLNVIEFGPGIYGIGRATRHLFGKTPKDLEPQEAAYLASILPSPKRHYKKFCVQRMSRGWRRWVDKIMRIMKKRNRLNPSELELAEMSPIRFSEEEWGSKAECFARLDRFRTRPRRRTQKRRRRRSKRRRRKRRR